MLQKLFCVSLFLIAMACKGLLAQNKQDWQRLLKQFPEKPRKELIAFKCQTIDTPPPNRISNELLLKTVFEDSMIKHLDLIGIDNPVNKFITQFPNFSEVSKLHHPVDLIPYCYLNFAVAKGQYYSRDTTFLCIEFYQYYLGQTNRLCLLIGFNTSYEFVSCESCYHFTHNTVCYDFMGYINNGVSPVILNHSNMLSLEYSDFKINHNVYKVLQDLKTEEVLFISVEYFYNNNPSVFYWSPRTKIFQQLLCKPKSDKEYQISFPGDPSYSKLIQVSERGYKYTGYNNKVQYFVVKNQMPEALKKYIKSIFNFGESYVNEKLKTYFHLSNFNSSLAKIPALNNPNYTDAVYEAEMPSFTSTVNLNEQGLFNVIETASILNTSSSAPSFPSDYFSSHFLCTGKDFVVEGRTIYKPVILLKLKETTDYFHFLLKYQYFGYEWAGSLLYLNSFSKKENTNINYTLSQTYNSHNIKGIDLVEIKKDTLINVTEVNSDSLFSKRVRYILTNDKLIKLHQENDYATGIFANAFDSLSYRFVICRNQDSLWIFDNNDSINRYASFPNQYNKTYTLPWNNYKLTNYETFLMISDGNKNYKIMRDMSGYMFYFYNKIKFPYSSKN